MRECRTLGSVRGAARKGGPYRNRPVLSVGHVPSPDPCQHLSETLGGEEVSAPACL